MIRREFAPNADYERLASVSARNMLGEAGFTSVRTARVEGDAANICYIATRAKPVAFSTIIAA